MKTKRSLISLLLAISLLFGATGCTLVSRTTDTPPATVTASPTASGFPDFVSVLATARPAVVSITTEIPVRFFGRIFTQEGAGSGWILESNGLIVTNSHVVEGASSATVTLQDGRTFPVVSVRTDPASDLAVMKIDATNLPVLAIGNSTDLQVGEWVVAIGNALGLGTSATTGIVSAKGVSMSTGPSESVQGLIQTDAAINPGNSGGPLVNLSGQVVGINSSKIAEVGVEGMSYAIGIDEALPIIRSLSR